MIKIQISSDIKLKEEEKEKLRKGISRSLDKYLRDVKESLKKGKIFVEKTGKGMVQLSFKMVLPGKKVLKAVTLAPTPLRALPELRDRLERQARKWRTKIMKKSRGEEKHD